MRQIRLAVITALLAAVFLGVPLYSQIDPISTVVFATDPSGRAVTNLRADELQIFEDDVPQRLTAFHVAADGRLRDGLTPAATAGEAGRIVLVVVDDMHILPGSTPLARMLLRQIRDEILAPDDQVAVVSTGFSSVAQDLQRDPTHSRFNALIERMMGSGDPVAVRTTAAAASSAAVVDRINYNAIVGLRTARDVVSSIGRRGPGLKAVVYVSSGYHFDPYADDRLARAQSATGAPSALSNPAPGPASSRTQGDVVTALALLATEARRNAAAFYTIDPSAATGPDLASGLSREQWLRYVAVSRSGLRALSQMTGGFCACDGNADVRPALRRINSEISNYYVVAYRSDDQARQRRRVRIETSRPDVILRYAPDYYLSPR